MRAIDITGNRYNYLTVIGFFGDRNKTNEKLWRCKCDCGKEILVRGQDLKSGNTKSCGCKFRFKDHIENKRFGRVVVIRRTIGKNGSYKYLCKCDCGKVFETWGGCLKTGDTKSCGCLNDEKRRGRKTHGKSKSRLYSIYSSMKQRCYNTKLRAYKRYGGRGITICKEWENSFNSFQSWAESNGYKEDLTIERIDNNGNYEPSNCKWANKKEQARNRNTSKRLEYKGQIYTYAEWGEFKGLTSSIISARIRNGWSIEKTLETPIKNRNHL